MKKLRFIVFLSAACAACALIISCSKNNEDENANDGRRQVMSGQNDIEKGPDTAFLLPAPAYIMRLEGETLTLYEISGGEETAVTALLIDTSYYPPEDIKELNKGVVAYSKEEGYKKLENYTN